MAVEEGDLIITLPKVAKIRSKVNLYGGEMGIVVKKGPESYELKVYAVVINQQFYYLFEDEFEKLEDEC